MSCADCCLVCSDDDHYVKSKDRNEFLEAEDIEKMKSDYALTHYAGVFDDYAEMTIQYG